MAKNKSKKAKGEDVGGIAFIGCVVVGIGLGLYFRQPAVGTLLGVGVGFILMALIKLRNK
jgi:hypothetical protein